jgi:hypothetical protein
LAVVAGFSAEENGEEREIDSQSATHCKGII